MPEQIEFHVATAGDDKNPGTSEQPLATLEGARDRLRTFRRRLAFPLPATVYVHGGRYPLRHSFRLDREDGGDEEFPVTYTVWQDEKVVLDCGHVLPAKSFRRPTDPAILSRLAPEAREHVLCCDLAALGIIEYGEHHRPTLERPAPLELFVDGESMTIARWPNEETIPIERVVDGGAVAKRDGFKDVLDRSERGGVVGFDHSRIERWHLADDVWLAGNFHWGWYYDHLPVAKIDCRKRQMQLGKPHLYGIRSVHDDEWRKDGWRHIRRYYVYNLLEELDCPGEWYLDRKSGLLYLWPKSASIAEIAVSGLPAPAVETNGVSHLNIRGFTIQHGRGGGIRVDGGRKVRIEACVVRRIGGLGMDIQGGDHAVKNCDIYQTGLGGIRMTGGDRAALVRSRNLIVNCDMHRFDRRAAACGVRLGGAGATVRHCFIHDSGSRAIGFHGNDHRIELNRIENVATQGDDLGATGIGRNPSERGTVIRHNFFCCIGSEPNHVTSIYLDDGSSGITVAGNVFYRASSGNRGCIFMNGGSDNTIVNNVFVDSKLGVNLSDCYHTWAAERLPSWLDPENGDWIIRLTREIDHRSPIWQTRYPELARFFEEDCATPKRIVVSRNLAVRSKLFIISQTSEESPLRAADCLRPDNWATDRNPGFADVAQGDFRLIADAEVYRRIPDFEAIPFERIGLCRNY